jgi:hypothetical protein
MHRQSMLPSVPGTATNKLGAEICVQLFDKENVGSQLFAPQPVEIGALAHTLHMYSQIIARQHKIKTTTAGQASERANQPASQRAHHARTTLVLQEM